LANWWIKTGRIEDNEVEATMAGKLKTMPTSPLSVVIQHLLADLRPEGDGMTDGELLARFQRSRDEDALAALVRRHASMVWGVCRRLLHHHDAEDAFQATFLVLVRKAADVPGQAVANWLYGVARQTAVRLRATAAKRGRRETQVVNMPEPTVPTVHDADVQAVVDEELSRLPDHYRGVIVVCDLEGMTRKEAARQLGIPEGSVASRLARARALLAKRLAQRGVVFAGSVAAVLSAGSASGSAPTALVASTIKAASLLAAGQAAGVVSAKVAALSEGVVNAMFTTKIKGVLAVVLVVGLALGGIGLGINLSVHQSAVAQGPKITPNGRAVVPGELKITPDGKAVVPGDKAKKADEKKPAEKEQKVLTPEEAIKQMPKENVTVQFKVASVEWDLTHLYSGYPGSAYTHLKDGGKFRASLICNQFARWDADQIKKLGIEKVEDFKGKMLRVTGRVEHFGDTFVMWVRDGKNIEVVKE
jgi:RNA polymerase sigma factor (sigma-70 family)